MKLSHYLPSLVLAACVWHKEDQGSAKPAGPAPCMHNHAHVGVLLGEGDVPQVHMGANLGNATLQLGLWLEMCPVRRISSAWVLCYFPCSMNALRCPAHIINLSTALADTFIELPIMTPKYFPQRIVQVQRPESWRKRA